MAVPADVGAAARLSTYRFYDPQFNVGLDNTTSKQRESSHVTSEGAVLDITYDLGPGKLRSITGYNAYDSNDQRDVDWSPTPFLFEPITQEFSQWSQELRFVSDIGERFDYIAGLYWFRTEFFVDRRTDVDINLFFSPIENLPTRKYSTLRFLDQTAETYSAYAQGTFHVTPNLHFTTGGRFTREKKAATDRLDLAAFASTRFLNETNPADAALLATARALNPGIAATRHAFDNEKTEENFIPEGKLSWDISEDLMVYGSVTKGYKGGGFNSNSTTQNEADFTFRPETVIGYELGGKARLPAQRINANFAFFRQDFKDLQLSIFTGNGFFLTNAGASRSQGFEADVAWQVTERFRLTSAVTLLDAKFTERVLAACNIGQLNFGQAGCFNIAAPTTANPAATRPVQDFNGKRSAAKYSATLGAAYIQPLSDDFEVVLRADAQFRAKGQFALDPTITQPAYQLLDLGATLRPTGGDRRWTLGVSVSNVFDKERYFFEFEAPAQTGTRIGFVAPPRRAVFKFTYDF